MNNIDHKKLIKLIMAHWMVSEGGCWIPDDEDVEKNYVTIDEQKFIDNIQKSLQTHYDKDYMADFSEGGKLPDIKE